MTILRYHRDPLFSLKGPFVSPNSDSSSYRDYIVITQGERGEFKESGNCYGI